jgi:hypothetical protein
MDKGLAFKREEVKEQFTLGGAQNVEYIWSYLQILAKFVIPLDTNLWHSLSTSCEQENQRLRTGLHE